MMSPRAVIFDLGKVLLDFDYGIAIRRLLPKVRLTEAELQRLLNQSPLLYRYETGLLSSEEFFQEVRAATGFTAGLAEFRSAFAEIFSEIKPMVAVHEAVRRRGTISYVFSNTNEIAMGHIRERFAFIRNFDDWVLSYEHRAMKPDPALYEVLEQRAGLRGPDLFYLDDRPENVAAALARGWRAVVHESPERSRLALEQVGAL